MIVVNHLSDISTLPRNKDEKEKDKIIPLALTIGNFDGVHLGHSYLFQKLCYEAKTAGYKVAAMTFCPHPWAIISPEKRHFLIDSYEERREHLEKIGVEILVEVSFTRDFSDLTPDQFIRDHLLVPFVDLKLVYLGHDFSFGKSKKGNALYIQENYSELPFLLQRGEAFRIGGEVVSSTLIRGKIANGLVDEVPKYLGRYYKMSGKVIKGKQLARELGFPTANLQVAEDKVIPKFGVYMTQTHCHGQVYPSITNVGENPTFERGYLRCETHLLNFNQNIYGEDLKVEFLQMIRPEKRFSDIHTLQKQIVEDVAHSRSFFHL